MERLYTELGPQIPHLLQLHSLLRLQRPNILLYLVSFRFEFRLNKSHLAVTYLITLSGNSLAICLTIIPSWEGQHLPHQDSVRLPLAFVHTITSLPY